MLLSTEIVTDSFCGAGGASHGIRLALGRQPEVAINHNPTQIRIHTANHPETEHFISDIWEVDPVEATGGRDVGFSWFSPDCTHFSKAKGGKPKSAKIRALAWTTCRWAKAVRPRICVVENVEEILGWCPLKDGKPTGATVEMKHEGVTRKVGTTFARWFRRMERMGYVGSWRVLRACDYGAPTTRKRVFFIFRRDGIAPQWPAPTHGDAKARAKNPALAPWRTAAECIDFTIPNHSIFLTSSDVKKAGLKIRRPLALPTLRRIARGMHRHVLTSAKPFIVPDGQAPILTQTGYGERHATEACRAQDTRVLDLQEPLGSIVACGIKHAVSAAVLAPIVVKHNGGHEGPGTSCLAPMDALVATNNKGLALACLTKYNGTQQFPDIDGPGPTITCTEGLAVSIAQTIAVDCLTPEQIAGAQRCYTFLAEHGALDGVQADPVNRLVFVRVDGLWYVVVDICMRMLTPRELARCQGFDDSYDIDLGGTLSKELTVRGIGNSVCPQLAMAIALANLGRPVGLDSAYDLGYAQGVSDDGRTAPPEVPS